MLLTPAGDAPETWRATAYAQLTSPATGADQMHIVIGEFVSRDPGRGVKWKIAEHLVVPLPDQSTIRFGDQWCVAPLGASGPETLLISQLDHGELDPVAAWTVTADGVASFADLASIECQPAAG